MLKITGYIIGEKLESDLVTGTDVYRARSLKENRQVIIRHIKNCQSSDYVYRIQHLINSENIAGLETVLSCFKEGDGLVIVAEDGGRQALSQRIKNNNLSLTEVLGIALQLNRIVGDIHAAGYVHKNINAHSVFVSSDNTVTLGGLELCAISNSENIAFSSVSQIEGNPAYISPEQTGRMNRAIDYRSDYYSLGMLMYQMLTGILPCQSDDIMTAIYCHIAQEAESPSKLNPQIPAMVSLVVLKLLEKNVENRYQSTSGIGSDLANCMAQLTQTGTIVNFPLAKDDFSEQLLFAEKLYGRDSEIKQLLAEYHRVVNGAKRVIYVSGESGSGKSGLIDEFSQLVFEDKLYCVKGKFDQQERAEPYSAFIQIFDNFVSLVENEDVHTQRYWKNKIATSLQSSLAVLTEFSARLQDFIGIVPKSEALGISETKNRFNAAIIRFIRCISAKECPLIMVVDDMHWADAASVELFDRIANDETIRYLLLIGIYRKKEANNNIFFKQYLLKKQRASDQSLALTLENLTQENVVEILRDVLHQRPEHVQSLAAQVFEKTGGNPYFIKQLLLDLKNSHYFHFSKSKHSWVWRTVPFLSESENVVDLITARLKRVSGTELLVLKYAALLGSRFSLSTLRLVCPVAILALAPSLGKLVDNLFLHYFDGEYRFSHDRVQQSVISLITDEEQKNLHYQIGMALFEGCSDKEIDNQIYKIVTHLNHAIELKKDDANFIAIVRNLNLSAAKRASAEAAYVTAKIFAQQAGSLLGKDTWQHFPDITFTVLIEQAKSRYLSGDARQALGDVSDVLSHVTTLDKQVIGFSLLKDIYTNQGLAYHDLLKQGTEILTCAGEKISVEPDALSHLLEQEAEQVDQYFSSNDIESVLEIPLSKNTRSKLLVQFYMEFWEACYYAGRTDVMRYCVLRMVSESLTFGTTSLSSFAYVVYASVLSGTRQYDDAYLFGKVALELNRKFANKSLVPKVNNIFCNYTSFHKKRFSESVVLYYESLQVAQETGDYLFGVWACYFYVWSLFLAGENLNDILLKSEKHLLFVKQTNDKKMLQAYRMLQSFLRYYSGQENDDVKTDQHNLACVNQWCDDGFLPGPAWYGILSMQRHYLEGNYEKAIDVSDRYLANPNSEIVMFPLSQYYFYRALSLICQASSANEKLSKNAAGFIADALKRIEEWALCCPENFSYQQYLIKAECARLKSAPEAEKYYLKALSAADVHGGDYIKALCFECQVRYLQDFGRENEADKALEKAAYYYKQWGAISRARALLSRMSVSVFVDQKAVDARSSEDFEIHSLIRASLAISSEIDMDQLLMKMLSIALEYSYADYGLLFFVQDEQVLLVAEKRGAQSSVFLDKPIALDAFEDVAKPVVDQVYRRAVDIILDDAKTHPGFQDDVYIRRTAASSIMCCPVAIRGDVTAIIYLENTLSVEVFKADRLPYFHSLLSQLAISLENARLYAGLKAEIEERKSIEAALRVSESRMRISQEYAKVGSWEYDLVSGDLYWSDGVKRIFDLPVDMQVDSIASFNDRVYPPDLALVDKAFEACLETGKKYYVEHRILLPNGDIKWVSETGDVQRDAAGKPVLMFGLIQDIDARKCEAIERAKLEHQLRQSQKMESIGQLTGGIAHDFNNMLASILGFTELSLANEAAVASPKLTQYLTQVLSAGERARDLVKQMLAFSRNEDSEKEKADIGLLVKQSIKMLSTVLPASISIKLGLEKVPLQAYVNPVQINQVVMNLCINARDAMHGAGQLIIDVNLFSADKLKCASCHGSVSGDFVRIRIKDTGEGVPELFFDRVFEPFFTTKEIDKGTGMGLSMVHGIVHGCDGHILLDSSLAEGTVFSVLLPAIGRNNGVTDRQHIGLPSLEKPQYDLKILVIDDELAIAQFLVDLFESRDIEANLSHDPKAACAQLMQSPLAYDLVIVDQTMPQLTGIELVKQVREVNTHARFILMTGYHEDIDEQVAKSAGCIGLLQKPFDTSTLFSLIDKLGISS